MMSSKLFNCWDFFIFSCLVILVKYWFIVLARTDSSEIRLLFSISINLLVFKPFLMNVVSLKRTPSQIFSCKFWEFIPNTLFTGKLWATSSAKRFSSVVLKQLGYPGMHHVLQSLRDFLKVKVVCLQRKNE